MLSPGGGKVDDDVDLDVLASLTDGYSGADVAIVCRDAAMMSVRRVMKGAMERGLSGPDIQKHVMEMKDELAAAVTMEDFRSSLRKASHSNEATRGRGGGSSGEGSSYYVLFSVLNSRWQKNVDIRLIYR